METRDSCLWLHTQLLNVILIWRPFMYLRPPNSSDSWVTGKKNKTKQNPLRCYPTWVRSPTHLWPWVQWNNTWQVSLCILAIWTLSQCTSVTIGYHSESPHTGIRTSYLVVALESYEVTSMILSFFLQTFFPLLVFLCSPVLKSIWLGCEVCLWSRSQGQCFRPWL